MQPLDYCIDKVAQPGTPGYYAVLFQPPAVRSALLALRTLHGELTDLVERCSERDIAQRKLLYWQQELQGTPGPSAHPVTRALHEFAAEALSEPMRVQLLTGVQRRIMHAQVRTESEVDELNAATAGTIACACARLTGEDTNAASALAVASERLRQLSLPGRAGLPAHSGIALSTLAKASATPAQVDAGGSDPALVAVRALLLEQLFAALQHEDLLAVRKRGYLATCVRITRCLTRASSRAGYAQSGQLTSVAPLRLLWHAWRARPPT